MTQAIFSLKSKYAEAIYAGIKRVEIRRVAPKQKVSLIWIYEVAPTRLITGWFIPGEISNYMSWQELFNKYGPSSITGSRLAGGVDVHTLVGDKPMRAIEIIDAGKLNVPQKLYCEKEPVTQKCRPPQSWRYCEEGFITL